MWSLARSRVRDVLLGEAKLNVAFFSQRIFCNIEIYNNPPQSIYAYMDHGEDACRLANNKITLGVFGEWHMVWWCGGRGMRGVGHSPKLTNSITGFALSSPLCLKSSMHKRFDQSIVLVFQHQINLSCE